MWRRKGARRTDGAQTERARPDGRADEDGGKTAQAKSRRHCELRRKQTLPTSTLFILPPLKLFPLSPSPDLCSQNPDASQSFSCTTLTLTLCKAWKAVRSSRVKSLHDFDAESVQILQSSQVFPRPKSDGFCLHWDNSGPKFSVCPSKKSAPSFSLARPKLCCV